VPVFCYKYELLDLVKVRVPFCWKSVRPSCHLRRKSDRYVYHQNSSEPVNLFLQVYRIKISIQVGRSRDRLSVSQSVLVSDTHPGLAINCSPSFFHYFIGTYGFIDVCPLWRQVRSIVFSCCWASPAQSLSGLSPSGLTAIFSLNFWDSPNWRARLLYLFPQRLGYLNCTPRQWVWLTHCQSRSYFTIDGQSVTMSWYRAPLWELRPDISWSWSWS
jgi:hypothetical protein